jgi:hypothetical protein
VRTIESGVNSDWSETWNFKVDETGLGAEESFTAASINVFPNPAKNQVTIESSSAIGQIQLHDFTGRIVFSENANRENRVTLDTQLPSGVYLIRMQLENGETPTKQLIIQ